MTTTLVLGGKAPSTSQHAAALLRGQDQVCRVVTGSSAGDDAATSDHPESWAVLETRDLTRALLSSRHPVLVDNVPDWLRGQLDDHDAWGDDLSARGLVDGLVDELAVASQALPYEVVIISQDLGWAPPANTDQERLFGELLGHVNERLSAASTRVHAVIAGRVLDLSQAPVVGH